MVIFHSYVSLPVLDTALEVVAPATGPGASTPPVRRGDTNEATSGHGSRGTMSEINGAISEVKKRECHEQNIGDIKGYRQQ